MTPISQIKGRAFPFGRNNVDTDAIIPAKYLKTISREGLGEGLFENIRQNEETVFDDPCYRNAVILLAGDNFGCGSSREHAVWALLDFGIKAVIAPSFSDIFASNAFKNGMLTIELPKDAMEQLSQAARSAEIEIDLEAQTVSTQEGERFHFPIDSFRKRCLLSGLDEIALTLQRAQAIANFERKVARTLPFLADAHQRR